MYTPAGHAFSCRPGPGALGATLALADQKGRNMYMRATVLTRDDLGEVLHVVRLEK